MEIIAGIFNMSAPLVLVSLGALLTEYTGYPAIFLEGCITAGAFIYTAVCIMSGSGAAGVAAAAVLTGSLMALLSVFVRKTRANPFICGLAVNLCIGGLVPIFAQSWFETQGVVRLPSAGITEVAAGFSAVRFDTICCYIFAVACWFFAGKTTAGLRLRMCAKESAFLRANGVNVNRRRDFSWGTAGAAAAIAGCMLSARMEAYIPGISSGNGWIALAVIFMGLTSVPGTVAAALVFTAAGYAANVLQGGGVIPGTLVTAVPYITALVCFAAAGIAAHRKQSARPDKAPRR